MIFDRIDFIVCSAFDFLGIGRAIALKLAKDKVNIVVAAKTGEPHPKLPGTIYTVAKESMNEIID